MWLRAGVKEELYYLVLVILQRQNKERKQKIKSASKMYKSKNLSLSPPKLFACKSKCVFQMKKISVVICSSKYTSLHQCLCSSQNLFSLSLTNQLLSTINAIPNLVWQPVGEFIAPSKHITLKDKYCKLYLLHNNHRSGQLGKNWQFSSSHHYS